MFVSTLLLQFVRKVTTAQTVLIFVLLTAKHVDTQMVSAQIWRDGWVITAQSVFLNANKRLKICMIYNKSECTYICINNISKYS